MAAGTKAAVSGALQKNAPKRKQDVLIPKGKRLKRRAKPGEEDEEEIGTKIEQSRTQVADIGPTPFTKSLQGTKQPDFLNIDKTKYKIWKPWLPEKTVP